MHRFLIRSGLLAIALVVGVLALAPHSPPADLTIESATDPRTLDPHRTSLLLDFKLIQLLFEGLVRYDPEFRPVPGCAASWDVAPDGHSYTFHLRPGLRWSNGDPLEARDFVFAWERALDPHVECPYAFLFFPIRNARRYYASRLDDGNAAAAAPLPFAEVGLRTPDPLTLVVELEEACPYFLDLAAFPTFLPLHRPTIEKYAWRDGKVLYETLRFWTQPELIVGNGPYTLREWRFRQRLRFAANPHYHERARLDAATIDAVVLDEAATALVAYQTGSVAIVDNLPLPVVQKLAALTRAGARSDFQTALAFGTQYFLVNCQRPPLDDRRVRQALALALDREAICTYLLATGERPAYRFVPADFVPLVQVDAAGIEHRYSAAPGLGEGEPDAARVRRAQALLAEAGFPGGAGCRTLELLFVRSETWHKVLQAIGRMWQERLGIPIRLVQQERSVVTDREDRLEFDLGWSGWWGDYLDPNTFLDLWTTTSGFNRTGWERPAYDQLIEEAARTFEPGRRFAILARAEAMLVTEELPVIPVYHPVNYLLVDPRLEGIRANSRAFYRLDYVRRRDAAATGAGGGG